MTDLSGRTALVTGAFSGLGLHFARVLAAHGAKVALAGRRIELGRTVAAEIGAAVGRPADVRAYALDVTDAGERGRRASPGSATTSARRRSSSTTPARSPARPASSWARTTGTA